MNEDSDIYCDVCSAVVGFAHTHSYVKGICECGEQIIQLDETTLAFAAQIELRPKFYIPANLLNNDNIKMVIVQDTAFRGQLTTEYTMAELRTNGKIEGNTGRYYFVFTFASGEMGKNLSIQFINTADGSVMAVYDAKAGANVETINRTVAEAAIATLQDPTAKQSLKDLNVAALMYGGYAQIRFNVDADKPVFNLLAEYGFEMPSMDGLTADMLEGVTEISGADIGIKFNKATAEMNAAILERVYFKLDAGHTIDEYTFKLTSKNAKGELITTEVEATYNQGQKLYYVIIPDIASAYIDLMYKVEVIHNASGQSYVVDTCVLSWVKDSLETSTNNAVINLAKALYYYNQAANVHFNR